LAKTASDALKKNIKADEDDDPVDFDCLIIGGNDHDGMKSIDSLVDAQSIKAVDKSLRANVRSDQPACLIYTS
jgi:hypothetical protein